MIKHYIKKMLSSAAGICRHCLNWQYERKNLRRKRHLFRRIVIPREETARLKAVWKENYGRVYSLDWHRLYHSYLYNALGWDKSTAPPVENYFPEILFKMTLFNILNPYEFRKIRNGCCKYAGTDIYNTA
jgi:hypothetical protein